MFTFPLISQNSFQILLTVLRTVSSLHPISRFKEKSLNVGPISKKSFSKVKALAILILKGENFNHIGNLNDNGFQELKIRSLLKQKKKFLRNSYQTTPIKHNTSPTPQITKCISSLWARKIIKWNFKIILYIYINTPF